MQKIHVFTDNYKHIPELFDRNDLSIMLDCVEKCEAYPIDPVWNRWMKERDKCILAMLYYTGCRPKEILSLRYDDFKPKIMAFHIRAVNNKQRKERIIPICEELVPFIKNYLMYGRKGFYIFPSYEDKGKPLSPERWKAILREKILKPSGLWIPPIGTTIPRTRSYSFRASFANRMIDKTKDLKMVMAALGDTDWRTMKHYIEIWKAHSQNIDDLRKAMSD